MHLVVLGASECIWSYWAPATSEDVRAASPQECPIPTCIASALQATLPARDEEHPDLLRKAAQRDQELYDHGRNGYRLTSTIT